MFGKIVNDGINQQTALTEMGIIAQNEWLKLIQSNVKLGDFVIMPNHIHRIIILNDTYSSKCGLLQNLTNETGLSSFVKAEGYWTLRSPSNNIGAIVRGYKSAVTKQIRMFDADIVV